MAIGDSEGRVVSVSSAPYDGHPLPQALEHLARAGVTHVEPAYIVGYSEPFDERAFSEAAAARWRGWLAADGLACFAVSAHIDLGTEEAAAIFMRRMDFARAIGARVINTNASLRARRSVFERTMNTLARHGEEIGLRIGLENPGNGEDNLFNTAAEGHALLADLGLPGIGLNFDAANLASHRPEADVTANAVAALPDCVHVHIKDVRRDSDGWQFTAIGQGDLDVAAILAAVAARPELPVSVELPLRLRRGPDAQPIRAPAPVPLAAIEAAVAASFRTLAAFGL